MSPPSAPDTRSTMNGKPVLFRPAKTVLNMHSKFADKRLCDGPTFSLGDACAYSCSFCYVPDMMRKAAYVPKDQPHADIVVRRQDALDILAKQIVGLKFEIRNQPLVIYSSPLVDVAANMDLVRETIEACAIILKFTHWHIRLLSKSNLLPHVARGLIKAANDSGKAFTVDDTVRRMIYGVSTGTLDDAQAAAFEQGCPKVSKRLESLHWLQDEGFRTFGMICPTLPQRDYTQWADDMFHAIRATRHEHIWAEVINVRGDSMTKTTAALHHAGYEWQAAELDRCSRDKTIWEQHARQTFLALSARMEGMNHDHPDNLDPPGGKPHPRLRFLQYVTKDTRPWWQSQTANGAILL